MKTKAFKYLKWMVMAVFMINLTACEVEIDHFYDDDYEEVDPRTDLLCSRTWISDYRDVAGNRCRQELDFYLDGVGVDYIRVEYPGGRYTESEYRFKWRWDNFWQTSIRMDYGKGDVSYLDGVYLSGNTLSGYLDGKNNYVEFRGKK